MSRRRQVAALVVAAVAVVHVWRPLTRADGPAFRLWASYASDVLVPVGAWFVLVLARRLPPALRSRRARAAVVFGAAAFAETAQGLGVPLLGRTFDPVDYACYAAGTALAVALEAGLSRLPGLPVDDSGAA